jgi:hypothetical protein
MRAALLHALAAVALIAFGVLVQNRMTSLLFGIAAGLQIGLAIFKYAGHRAQAGCPL